MWLAVVAAVNTVVSLYYYARVIRNMFLRSLTDHREPLVFSRLQTAMALLLLIPTILFGVYFTLLADLANASVKILGSP